MDIDHEPNKDELEFTETSAERLALVKSTELRYELGNILDICDSGLVSELCILLKDLDTDSVQ